jgi:hypothetical protein
MNYQFSLTELFELRKSEINKNLKQIFKMLMEVKLSSVKSWKCVANNGTTLMPLAAVQTLHKYKNTYSLTVFMHV